MPRLLTAIYCPAIFACVPEIQADEEPPAPKPESKGIGDAPKLGTLKLISFQKIRSHEEFMKLVNTASNR